MSPQHLKYLALLAGRGVQVVSRALSLMILAKFTDTATVGIYAFAVAVTTPVGTLCSYNLRTLIIADPRAQMPWLSYLRFRGQSIALAIGLFLFLALICSNDPTTRYAILGVGLIRSTEMLSDLFDALWQHEERFARLGVLAAVKGFSVALCFYLFAQRGIFVAALAVVAAWLIVMAVFEIPLFLKSIQSTSRALQKSFLEHHRMLLKSGFPLLLATTLAALAANIHSYAIKAVLDAQSLGIFAACMAVVQAGLVGVESLSTITQPKIAKAYVIRDYATMHRVLFFGATASIAGGAILALLSYFKGEWILRLCFNEEIAKSSAIFTTMMSAAIVYNLAQYFFNNAQSLGLFKKMLTPNALALFFGVALYAALLPQIGLYAAPVVFIVQAMTTMACTVPLFLKKRALNT